MIISGYSPFSTPQTVQKTYAGQRMAFGNQPPAIPKDQLYVLVVEDDETEQILLRRRLIKDLQINQDKIHIFSNAPDAYRATRGLDPANRLIVFLDETIKGKRRGSELAVWLNKHLQVPWERMICISGEKEEKMKNAFKNKPVVYLGKDYTLENLIKVVNSLTA